MTHTDYQYTNDWHERTAKGVWDDLIPQINPTRILEIGSYEGASACYMIDMLARDKRIEIHCVDTWQGGIEHKEGGYDMPAAEQRFLYNTKIAIDKAAHSVDLKIHKGSSDIELAKLLADGLDDYFDFVYIDGSHQAPDVLTDAVLGFRLLKKGGVIAFDDYLWFESLPYGIDPVRCPKMAIDAFTNIYCRKIRVISAHLWQLYVQKVED